MRDDSQLAVELGHAWRYCFGLGERIGEHEKPESQGLSDKLQFVLEAEGKKRWIGDAKN